MGDFAKITAAAGVPGVKRDRPVDTVSVLCALGTIFIWAWAFSAIRVGLTGFTGAQLALFRFLVASLGFGLYALWVKMPLPQRKDWFRFFWLGNTGMTVYFLTLNYGEVLVPAGTASLINSSTSVITAVLAAVVLDELLTAWGWLGVLVSFSGVTLIVIGSGRSLAFTVSALLIVISALSFSLYWVFVQPLFERYTPLQVTAYSTWAATVPTLVFLPGLLRNLPHVGPAVLWTTILFGVAGIAYFLWAVVLARGHTGRWSTALNLWPVVALLIAWAWLGEIPATLSLVGGSIAIFGIMVVSVWG